MSPSKKSSKSSEGRDDDDSPPPRDNPELNLDACDVCDFDLPRAGLPGYLLPPFKPLLPEDEDDPVQMHPSAIMVPPNKRLIWACGLTPLKSLNFVFKIGCSFCFGFGSIFSNATVELLELFHTSKTTLDG